MKYEERVKWVESELLSITKTASRLPTKRELIGSGRGSLDSAISYTGGYRFWARRMGVGTTTAWDESLIEKNILSLVGDDYLMPSARDMKPVCGLACAVTRHPLKFRGWAKRLGLKMKNSHTQRSYVVECWVRDRLRDRGLHVELTRCKAEHDLEVGGLVHVEVKLARRFTDPRLGPDGAFIFSFGSKGKTRAFDVAALVCVDVDDKPLFTYWLPKEMCAVQTVTITGAARWVPWLERWDLVGDQLVLKKAGRI